MFSLTKKLLLTSVVAIATLLSACDKENDNPITETTVVGETLPIGNGTVRSWAKFDAEGNPTEAGCTLSKEVMSTLPGMPHNHQEGEMVMYYYELDLPAELKEKTPFSHIGFDWNPMGHPSEIYMVPHFDAHFYMITPEQQMQIGTPDVDSKLQILPAPQYLPVDYIDIGVDVPQMGKHWVDKFTPELNGEKFTYTMIYGSYDGEVTFYEPMFTKEFLLTKPDLTLPIKQPADFQRKGLYYPTTYTLRFDAETDEYVFSIGGFELK